MTPSSKCLEVIKHFEGCKLGAYLDEAGIPTIGIGTTVYATGKPVKMGDKLTEKAAEIELLYDLQMICSDIDNFSKKNKIILNQNQFDAVSSILYNCGSGLLSKERSLGSALMSGDAVKASDSFLLYCKIRTAGKLIISQGLLRRRKTEAHLYLTGEVKLFWGNP